MAAVVVIVGACAGGPAATPSCTAASIDEVLSALENVPGYTFSSSGTSLGATPRFPDSYEYKSVPVELRGAFRAPNRSRLEVVAGGRSAPPLSAPTIFLLAADSIVVVGDRMWLVSQGHVQGAFPSDPIGANQLLEILRGGPELIQPTWASSEPCRYTGTGQRGAISESLQIEVGPGALPHTIVQEWRFEPPNSGPRQAYDLTYRVDFAQVPEIASPGG